MDANEITSEKFKEAARIFDEIQMLREQWRKFLPLRDKVFLQRRIKSLDAQRRAILGAE